MFLGPKFVLNRPGQSLTPCANTSAQLGDWLMRGPRKGAAENTWPISLTQRQQWQWQRGTSEEMYLWRGFARPASHCASERYKRVCDAHLILKKSFGKKRMWIRAGSDITMSHVVVARSGADPAYSWENTKSFIIILYNFYILYHLASFYCYVSI